ncbi:MAG: hypothetical protein KAS66_14520, partial [Candidatus Omnitrophica bacterium]|nr:hypothetical protein [Candidatus Omnitrophota bacterium]
MSSEGNRAKEYLDHNGGAPVNPTKNKEGNTVSSPVVVLDRGDQTVSRGSQIFALHSKEDARLIRAGPQSDLGAITVLDENATEKVVILSPKDEESKEKILRYAQGDEKGAAGSPINYDVTPGEYQTQMNKNFADKDRGTLNVLKLSFEEQSAKMKGNRLAFIPADQQELERSLFLSVDLRENKDMRAYARTVQEKIIEILGDRRKIRLNDLETLHTTVVGNLIGDNTLDISDQAIAGIYNQYKNIVADVNAFDIAVHGPHLMDNFGIVLEVRTGSKHLLAIRRAAQQILDQTILPEGVRAFVPDITHISLGYLIDAQPEELRKIYEVLKQFRLNIEKPVRVKAEKIQIAKTINKSMKYDGAKIFDLPSSSGLVTRYSEDNQSGLGAVPVFAALFAAA